MKTRLFTLALVLLAASLAFGQGGTTSGNVIVQPPNAIIFGTGNASTDTYTKATAGGLSINQPLSLTEVAAPTCVASVDWLWADSTAHTLKHCDNNGSAQTVATVEASQTFSGNPTFSGFANFPGDKAVLTADWTCGTGGTVASCAAATIVGSTTQPMTFTLPLVSASWMLDCDFVVGQATAATSNQWNLLTATNGATNVTASYTMATAATAMAVGAVTDTASTTTTFQISPNWTLGGTATKMPAHIHAAVQGASASGTVLSVQILAPTVADLVTIYQGSGCYIH